MNKMKVIIANSTFELYLILNLETKNFNSSF